MSSYFPNGTQYSFSTTLGDAITVTAISNADPAVVTAASQPADGSIILIKSGWSALNDTVAKTDNNDSSGSFELQGVDTTSTSRFPAAEGSGSVQVASAFTSLTQIQTVAMSGGDQQFYQFQYVEDFNSTQHQKPTFKNAMTLTFTMDYDPALSWYTDLIAADQSGALIVLKALLPSGDTNLYACYPSFNKVATVTKNENQMVTATFSLASAPVRYAAT